MFFYFRYIRDFMLSKKTPHSAFYKKIATQARKIK